MIRASLALAVYLTLLLAVGHGLVSGDGGPMIAASLLALLAPGLLRRAR